MFRKSTVFLFLLLVVLSASWAVSAQDTSTFLRYPIDADPEHLNPFTADTITIGRVNRNLYEGLTRYNAETGEVDPAIAEGLARLGV